MSGFAHLLFLRSAQLSMSLMIVLFVLVSTGLILYVSSGSVVSGSGGEHY